jgi:hypothetical protein
LDVIALLSYSCLDWMLLRYYFTHGLISMLLRYWVTHGLVSMLLC